LSGAAVEWLVRPDQAHLLPPGEIFGKGESTDFSWVPQVRDRVIKYTQSGDPGASLWVLSYDNAIQTQVEHLERSNSAVRAQHLADLIRAESAERRQQRSFRFAEPAKPLAVATAAATDGVTLQQPQTGSLPVAEAIELAKRVLRFGKHVSRETALPQKDLRIRMISFD
jgi:hypothetical protein